MKRINAEQFKELLEINRKEKQKQIDLDSFD
jgi:hypothetical protein